MKSTMRTPFAIFFSIVLSIGLNAQEGKKVLSIDDYPQWSSIVSAAISDDGNWINYSYRPNGGDDTLYFKNINSGKLFSEAYGERAQFSKDSKWVVYKKNLQKKKAEKLRKNKKTVYTKGVLLELETGKKLEWDKVSTISISPRSDFTVIKKTTGSKDFKGSDLLLKNMKTGSLMNIGNVSQYKFNKKGSLLAYIVDADSKAGNGVYLMDLASGKVTSLDTDSCTYSQLTWDDEMLYPSENQQKGSSLAVLAGNKLDSLTQ
ncbi:MAG: hypothetical protein QNK33_09290, partial [Bacteroidales bacterium]|nr:hypothetical protein [Bacteroidales bacterium]